MHECCFITECEITLLVGLLVVIHQLYQFIILKMLSAQNFALYLVCMTLAYCALIGLFHWNSCLEMREHAYIPDNCPTPLFYQSMQLFGAKAFSGLVPVIISTSDPLLTQLTLIVAWCYTHMMFGLACYAIAKQIIDVDVCKLKFQAYVRKDEVVLATLERLQRQNLELE